MVNHVFNIFFPKILELTSEICFFCVCVSSSTFLTASCLPIFVSTKPSWTKLLIDRSEPRFESHTAGEIM